MQLKSDPHIFSGMQRDMSVSKQKAESLYDAKNLRFTARDGDTMLSITNEKGTSKVVTELRIEGDYLGHCVVDDYVVLFTHRTDGEDTPDHIYKITNLGDTTADIVSLYEGNLKFSAPIETLGVYENDNIQKVYWTDGVNQPRMIFTGSYNHIQPNDASHPNSDFQFDFVPTLNLNEVITVARKEGSGLFAPGTIQYAFTYYNKYGRQSNIFYTTPLYYISYNNRGGSPEDKIANTFIINVDNVQKDSFDYLRVYSIHRTTLDAVPTARRVMDVDLSTLEGNLASVTDDGIIGNTIDPTELLYMGGEMFYAQTMTQKDNTLFFGNLELTRLPIDSTLKEYLKTTTKSIIPIAISTTPIYGGGNPYYDYYTYYYDTPGFKVGEHYRLGVQFQHKSGKWSEPVPLGEDYIIPSSARALLSYDKKVGIQCSINIEDYLEELQANDYIRYREVCVLPSISDRLVLTQGIINPTVFNFKYRETGTPFVQSSWFFRPNPKDSDHNSGYEFRHSYVLKDELQLTPNNLNTDYAPNSLSEAVSYWNTVYGVDQSIVTMHSPEIEFDDSFNSLEYSNFKLRLVGIANLGAQVCACDIQTSTPRSSTMGTQDNKQFHRVSKYSVDANTKPSFSYLDNVIIIESDSDHKYIVDKDNGAAYTVQYKIYPWQRSGSLNNETNRPTDKGVTTSVLKSKKISSLKFFHSNTFFNTEYNINSNKISVFDSDQLAVLKVPYLPKSNFLKSVCYYGNVDTMVSYTQNTVPLLDGSTVYIPYIKSTPPVTPDNVMMSSRIKYKSTRHLVFSLMNESIGGANLIMPRLNATPSLPNDLPVPYWEADESVGYDIIGGIQYDSKYKVAKLLYFGTATPESFLASLSESDRNALLVSSNTHKGVYIRDVVDGTNHKYYLYCVNEGATGLTFDHFNTNTVYIYFHPNQGGNKTAFYMINQSTSEMHTGFPSDYTGPTNFTDIEDNPGTNVHTRQDTIDLTPDYPYLFLGELYRDPTPEVDFGGIVATNMWIPAGEPKPLSNTLLLKYVHGDTWYQRYDCLKTYPFTMEDENSITEIGSFLCETRINIDGRYDRNRGEVDNTVMSPINFNLLNPVYTQSNNFFNYRILDEDYYNINRFSNQITWSKEKANAADIDLWTNITMANTFDLDGTMGPIEALRTWQDIIYCFQDNAISVISFNPRVQIPTNDGVPIEVSNSYKLEGKYYISDSIGCKNKQTIAVTPSGIYFIDPNSKEFFHLAGKELSSVSTTHGFSNWFKNNELTHTFYDKNRNDVYVLNDTDCIVYSELLGQFTSFMDYCDIPAMFNINDRFYAFNDLDKGLGLYSLFTGEYNYFFNDYKPYWLEFISNADSSIDKTFSTIETRVDFRELSNNEWQVVHNEFFDTLQAENEYQKGVKDLSKSITASRADAKKKFRVWRVDIPRDTAHPLHRIRNTWAKIKFTKDPKKNQRMELHDVNVQYFI